MTYLDFPTQYCLYKVHYQAGIAPVTYVSSFNHSCKKKKTWSSIPNVLPEAAVVATAAPIGVKICSYGHSRGIFFLVHALSCDN